MIRLTRLRFTIRRMMAGVAFAGVVLSLIAYRDRLSGRGRDHAMQVFERSVPVPVSPSPQPGTMIFKAHETGKVTAYRMTPESEWHARMLRQYSDSAFRVGLFIGAILLATAVLTAFAYLRRRSRPHPETV